LDEGARFCRTCGTPVEVPTANPIEAATNRRARPFPLLIVSILIAVIAVGFIFAALALAPIQRVNFHQTESQPIVTDIDALNFRLDADVANVNVICMELPNQLAKLDVTANGSIGLFGSTENPLRVTVERQISANTVTINSQIVRTDPWPLSGNLNVVCNIYVNPTAPLRLNIQTGVGKITLETANVQTYFKELFLHTSTGDVEANLSEERVSASGNASVTTTTGSVTFTWRNARVPQDLTLNLASTTGSVIAEVSQTLALDGNVILSASTTTGNVDLNLDLRGDVAAQITSRTNIGSISTDVQNFNGNKSPIYSNNYPASNNFLVELSTTTGNIHVTAAYQGSQIPRNMQREQIRDSAMTYLKTHHPETAQFMADLSWTGGRVENGLGAEVYTWRSGAWTFTLTYPVVPNPIYSLTADYQTQGIGIPYRVVWTGTWRDGAVEETSFVFAQ
jgi:hypothetical protein